LDLHNCIHYKMHVVCCTWASHSFIVPDLVVYNFRFIEIAIRDQPIYWPSRYIGRYLGFTNILVSTKTPIWSASIGVDKTRL